MREYTTRADRLGAFTDAVLAVIITAMVLELEPFMVTRKQFCLSDGEAIREEGGAGRIEIRPSPSDKAGARQRETLRAG